MQVDTTTHPFGSIRDIRQPKAASDGIYDFIDPSDIFSSYLFDFLQKGCGKSDTFLVPFFLLAQEKNLLTSGWEILKFPFLKTAY